MYYDRVTGRPLTETLAFMALVMVDGHLPEVHGFVPGDRNFESAAARRNFVRYLAPNQEADQFASESRNRWQADKKEGE